jgi:hypothetical protein
VLLAARLPQQTRLRQDLLRARSHPIVFRQVPPPDGARPVQQKLGWPGHGLASDARPLVRQPVLANDRTVRVGEDRERVAGLACEIGRDRRRVDADGDRANAPSLEFGELLLETP